MEFLQRDTGTAHLTQLGSMSLPDTSMAGDLVLACAAFSRIWMRLLYNIVWVRTSDCHNKQAKDFIYQEVAKTVIFVFFP